MAKGGGRGGGGRGGGNRGGPRRPGGGGPGGGRSAGPGGRPGGRGPGGGGGPAGAPGGRKPRGGPRGARGTKPARRGEAALPAYFTQPGRHGTMIVLRRPIGNRATPKICGIMPSRVHAKMLIDQLLRAESVVKDLFMEATDDGIEALEAILAACVEEVMRRGPRVGMEPAEGSGFGEDVDRDR